MTVVTFDGSETCPLDAWRPPCVERTIPGVGSTWIHGYTGADVARWRRAAANLALEVPEAKGADGAPSEDCLRLAQVLCVCRTGPGATAATFVVSIGTPGVRQAWEAFSTCLPGTWVQDVCRESDLLTMMGYLRPIHEGQVGAEAALSDQLQNPKFWAALDHLSLSLYRVPIAENGHPLGDVLAMLERDAEVRSQVLGAVGALAGAVGG